MWYFVRPFSLNPHSQSPQEYYVFGSGCLGQQLVKELLFGVVWNISFPWRLTIGDHVWVGEDVSILCLANVTIESHVCVSQMSFCVPEATTIGMLHSDYKQSRITLEVGSWVAAMSFIGPGVVVGRGSVCAAGSVVTKSLPSYCLPLGILRCSALH